MSDANTLKGRIDAELGAARKRVEDQKAAVQSAHEELSKRLVVYNTVVERLRPIWKPRLELLLERFAGLAEGKPELREHTRQITFHFKSSKYHIDLTLASFPDRDIRNLVLEYNLKVIPILVKFEDHARMEMPLDRVDEAAVARWVDDRIVSFVQTYVPLQGDDFFLDNCQAK